MLSTTWPTDIFSVSPSKHTPMLKVYVPKMKYIHRKRIHVDFDGRSNFISRVVKRNNYYTFFTSCVILYIHM